MPDENPQEAIQKLLDKHKGDAQALALALFGENTTLRAENADLKKRVPAEGAVVLSKADSERWEKYKVLGKIEDLEKAKGDAETLAAENATLKRESSLRALASAGYDFDGLKDFDELEGKSIESYAVKKGKDKDGKEIETAYVMVGGKEQAFEDYAKEKRPRMMAALKAEGQTTGGGGTRVHGTAATTGTTGKDIFQKQVDEVKAKEQTNEKQAGDLHPMFKQQAA